MSKKNKTPLKVFIESIKLYFSNIDKFIKYMTFPVLGQIIGLTLVFILTYFYAKNMTQIINKIPNFNNPTLLIGILALIALPGLLIFIKSFWEYLIAYGAINSMLENMLKSGKVYDFDAHTELIKRRSIPFIGLWFLFSVFTLIAIIPLFWIPCGVLAIFFVLIFQVFTFEPNISPIACAKKSLYLIKGHFASTFLLFVLISTFTYILIPNLTNRLCEYINLTSFLTKIIIPIIKELPINEFNKLLYYIHLPLLTTQNLAIFTITTIITQIVIQYTLPIRSILWSMWYKELNGGKLNNTDKITPKTKRKTKKPSEKLIKASHKKYSSKKIDKNILKRALEKPDDD